MRDFPNTLKDWRHLRRLSQLQLASEAGVSPRHLAFLETGRSRPSRGMVLRLAEVLALPHAAQNTILTAAGFSPQFPTLGLDAVEMASVRRAMDWTITRHAPYPGLIMDRLWRIVAMNRTGQAIFGAAGFGEGTSLLDALTDPGRFEALIENWGEVGHHTLLRLRGESARAGGLAELDRAAAFLAADPRIAAFVPQVRTTAVIPTLYRMGDQRLALFSTYAQFGSAEEVGLADMKIELMFPADEAARQMLEAIATD